MRVLGDSLCYLPRQSCRGLIEARPGSDQWLRPSDSPVPHLPRYVRRDAMTLCVARRASFESPAGARRRRALRMRSAQGKRRMLRKLSIFALIVAVAGAAAFWIVTIPATVPASALVPRTPDLANGRTMLLAGGCPSCHATPGQDDRTRLGGGLAIKTAFGTFHAPNVSSDAKDGIGGWGRAEFF